MGRIFDIVILVAYPAIVVLGLIYLGPRLTGLLLLLLLGRRLVSLILADKALSKIVLIQGIATAAIVGSASALDSALFLRLTPLAITLTVIAQFAVSLKHTPLIERFARLQKPILPAEEVHYCRKLTKIWVGALIINALIVAFALTFKSNAVWGIVVGPVSYGYLGMIFTVEYIYRKWRFQDFDNKNPIDKLLRPFLMQKTAP